MKKKSTWILVAIDVVVILIIYLTIHHFEKTNPENMNGGHMSSGKYNQENGTKATDQANDQSDQFNPTDQEYDQSDQMNDGLKDYQRDDEKVYDSAQATPKDTPEHILRPPTDMIKKNITMSDSGTFYNLHVVDAAGPAKYYELLVSNDNGTTWQIRNDDPFDGKGGGGNGVFFLNDQIGFISFTDSNGEKGILYRTEDGGNTFQPVTLPEIVRQMLPDIENYYVPFDTPEIPYAEDGVLKLLVDQGADGDYNGGSSAMFESHDQGQTWNYLKEVIVEENNG